MAQYSSAVSGLLAQVMRERGYPVVLGEKVAFWECPTCHGRRYRPACVCGEDYEPTRDRVQVYGPPLLIMPDHGAFRQVETKRCLVPRGNRFCENRYSIHATCCPLASGHDPDAKEAKEAWVCAATDAEKGGYELYNSKIKCTHCGKEHKNEGNIRVPPLRLSPVKVGLECPVCKNSREQKVAFKRRPLTVWVYDPRFKVQLGSLDEASDDDEGHHRGLPPARAAALPIIAASSPPRRTEARRGSLPEALKQAVEALYRLELDRNPDVGPGFRQDLEKLIHAITKVSDGIGKNMSPDDAWLARGLWGLIGVSVVNPPLQMPNGLHVDFRRLLMADVSQEEFKEFAQSLTPPSGLARPVAILDEFQTVPDAAGFSDLELAGMYQDWMELCREKVLFIAKEEFEKAGLSTQLLLTPLPDR